MLQELQHFKCRTHKSEGVKIFMSCRLAALAKALVKLLEERTRLGLVSSSFFIECNFEFLLWRGL